MEIVFYMDHNYSEEQFNFVISMTEEFLQQNHLITLFLAQDVCYQVEKIIEKFNDIEGNGKIIKIYINSDEWEGLGLREPIKDTESDSFSINYVKSKQFNQLLLEKSTSHEVRYIRL